MWSPVNLRRKGRRGLEERTGGVTAPRKASPHPSSCSSRRSLLPSRTAARVAARACEAEAPFRQDGGAARAQGDAGWGWAEVKCQCQERAETGLWEHL